MVQWEKLELTSATGAALDARLWRPESEIVGVVQLVHGMSEHIARYDELAQALCAAGYAVAGHTHLGHGEMAQRLGYFAETGGWDALVGDVHRLRQQTQALYPDKPYFLLGHSMGSFVVRTYCLSHEEGLRGVVLSGTGHQPQAVVAMGALVADVQKAFGMARKPGKLLNQMSFGSYNSAFRPNRTPYDWLSVNEENVDAYIADPYCGFPFTVQGYRDLFDGLSRLAPAHLGTMKPDVPVYLLSGALDPVGAAGKGVETTARELRAAGVADVTVKLYEGGRHEMFNETNRKDVFADLVAWLDARR